MTYEEAVEISLEALKKQIPEKPDDRSLSGATLLYCPRCGNYLDLQPNFCYECGQAILWE